jgi:hypothetical protein
MHARILSVFTEPVGVGPGQAVFVDQDGGVGFYDKKGEVSSLRYEQVNAMLLNEFLKEHRKVEDLKNDFQATVTQLTACLEQQAAQIQKVSAQLEASKPAPQVVNNP